MKITGKFKTYEVRWRPAGWTWAVSQIRSTRTIFGRRLPSIFDRWVDFGEARSYLEAQKMTRGSMEQWFKDSVEKYERYLESWGKSA